MGAVNLAGGSGRAGAGWAGCRWYGSGCGSQSGDLVPEGESSGHFGAIVVSGEAMAAGPEVRRDHAEHRQEPLGCAGCAEAFHGAFALPGRLVRVLRPVVQVLRLPVLERRHHLPMRHCVTAEFVGDQHPRRRALPLEELAEEPLGGLGVAPARDEDVRTLPSCSTARHRYCRRPLIVKNTSSRCHLSPGRGWRRRSRQVYSGPNLAHHCRIVS